MKKYLFLLAFILPFMAMGQGISCNKCWPKIAPTEKDSIVKGWIVYYKHWASGTSIKGSGIYVEGKEATAHYRVVTTYIVYNNGKQEDKAAYDLYKIEVDGKPFDLNKYYQFIPENQVVE